MSESEFFTYNKARYVFHVAYSAERDSINGVSVEKTLERLRETPMGKKYLEGVTTEDIRTELHEPGSYMNAHTDLGFWTNDEYGTYAENFVEYSREIR